jgi:hypothetical protein
LKSQVDALQFQFNLGMKFNQDKHGATSYADWTRHLRETNSLSCTPEFQGWLHRCSVSTWWPTHHVESFPELGQIESEHCQPFVSSMIASLQTNQIHQLLADGSGYDSRPSTLHPSPPNDIQDAFNRVSFNRRKPDIVLYKVGQRGACSITMLGDVKGRTSDRDFPDEEIGRILDMSKELMTDHQFLRQSLICFLTDGYRFQFFRCNKCDGSFAFHSSAVYTGVRGWQVFTVCSFDQFDLFLLFDCRSYLPFKLFLLKSWAWLWMK